MKTKTLNGGNKPQSFDRVRKALKAFYGVIEISRYGFLKIKCYPEDMSRVNKVCKELELHPDDYIITEYF